MTHSSDASDGTLVLESPAVGSLSLRGDPAREHRQLVDELATALGDEQAQELDLAADVHFLMLQSSPELSLAQAKLQGALEGMRRALGDSFVKRYYASLHRKLVILQDADVAAAAVPALQGGLALLQGGEPQEHEHEQHEVTAEHEAGAKTGVGSIKDEDLARVLRQRIGL